MPSVQHHVFIRSVQRDVHVHGTRLYILGEEPRHDTLRRAHGALRRRGPDLSTDESTDESIDDSTVSQNGKNKEDVQCGVWEVP